MSTCSRIEWCSCNTTCTDSCSICICAWWRVGTWSKSSWTLPYFASLIEIRVYCSVNFDKGNGTVTHVVLVHVVNHQLHVVLTVLQSFGCLDDVKPPPVRGFPFSIKPVVVPSHELAEHVVVAQECAPVNNVAVADQVCARALVPVKPPYQPPPDILWYPVRVLR